MKPIRMNFRIRAVYLIVTLTGLPKASLDYGLHFYYRNSMRKISYLFILLSFVVLVSGAYAQDTTGDTNTGDKDIILDKRPGVMRTSAQERKETIAENQEKRRDLQAELKEKRAAAKEEFAQRRADFKEKVSEIKDKRKQSLVTRIDSKLASVNKNMTDQLVKSIDRMSAVLEKIEARAAGIREEGVDTSTFDLTIEKANNAVANAQTSVSSQAGKEYVAEIEDEDSLKSTVGDAFSSLRADLKATHEVVKTAKEAVIAAAKELKVLIQSQQKNASSSADAKEQL